MTEPGALTSPSPKLASVKNISVRIDSVAGTPRIVIDGVAHAGVCTVPRSPDSTAAIRFGLGDFAGMCVEFYSVVIFSK